MRYILKSISGNVEEISDFVARPQPGVVSQSPAPWCPHFLSLPSLLNIFGFLLTLPPLISHTLVTGLGPPTQNSGPPPFSPPILAVTDFFQRFPPAPVPVETVFHQVKYFKTSSKPKNHIPQQAGVRYIPPFATHPPTLR